jgi:hypothetical protein
MQSRHEAHHSLMEEGCSRVGRVVAPLPWIVNFG